MKKPSGDRSSIYSPTVSNLPSPRSVYLSVNTEEDEDGLFTFRENHQPLMR